MKTTPLPHENNLFAQSFQQIQVLFDLKWLRILLEIFFKIKLLRFILRTFSKTDVKHKTYLTIVLENNFPSKTTLQNGGSKL